MLEVIARAEGSGRIGGIAGTVGSHSLEWYHALDSRLQNVVVGLPPVTQHLQESGY